MSRDKREPEYTPELETHFIMRLPEEPAKQLREVLTIGDNLKNRLTIQIENDMRRGEVRFDHWTMHAKIVDLPTIIESLKTIDNKSFYKSADIAQMMICKLESEPVEEESPDKKKKKDPIKVDKKYLWPHGITPPTKNVRKRRFRKTLRKKCVEAPEIEKEVKRLLRADNEAVSVSWEVVKEEDELLHSQSETSSSHTTINPNQEKKFKVEWVKGGQIPGTNEPGSNVVDIFGGAVSDSEDEDNINVEMEDSRLSAYDSRLSDTNSMHAVGEIQSKGNQKPTQFDSKMFPLQQASISKSANQSHTAISETSAQKSENFSSDEDGDYTSISHNMSNDNLQLRAEQLKAELEEMKQRKQRTQHEIAGMENLALRQRFQDILHTLNQDIMYKEMEYQGILVLQNSEDI